MQPIDRVLEFLATEVGKCPETWMQEGLDVIEQAVYEMEHRTDNVRAVYDSQNKRLAAKDAEIARLKDALRSAYMQDIFYGANWITWRYTSGFDRADEATQQKMAKEKAEEWMREESLL